jgi:hypothetical protein
MRVLEKCHQGGCDTGRGGIRGIDGKLNGNYLSLIPGLCPENRTN